MHTAPFFPHAWIAALAAVVALPGSLWACPPDIGAYQFKTGETK